MPDLLSTLALAATLGCGLVAGIFFAFSTFVMRALGQLPSSHGIAAMQAINVTVLNRWFFSAFFGTAVLCVAIVLLAPGIGPETQALRFCGAALYLFGCIFVTMAGNVPLNNRLAVCDPDSDKAEALWAQYLGRWTLWNHIRTAASLAAAGLFALTL